MTVQTSVTLWKSTGVRCVLVPQPDLGYYQVQLIRGGECLNVQAVETVDAAYPIARRWQLEHRAADDSRSTAA